MKRLIAYFHSSATAASCQKAEGASAAAHARGWTLIRFDIKSPGQIRGDIRYWRPAGCIVDAVTASRDILGIRAFAKQPTVFVDCDPQYARLNVSTLIQDASAVASAAASELSRHSLRSCAYAAWPGNPFWSEIRGDAFIRAMNSRGIEVQTFRIDKKHADRNSVVMAIAEWLRRLPLPTGVFTASDAMSVQVLEAAASVGLSVPENLMVIGTDNDEFFCENARPMLSSVSQDFHSVGSRAVEMIEEMLNNPSLAPMHESFKSIQIVSRASTRRSEKHDHAATEALDMIRERALSGITAAEALNCFSCSRRLAERRFRDVAGRSAMDEIHAIQIEHAKKLAAKPFVKLTAIPQMCGHTSSPYFQRLFKRIVGCTMREYRAQAR